MGQVLIGCSGWSYSDQPEKGGWTKVFYPSTDTKRLAYYSQFFNTAEMDSTFYEKFYSQMTKATFAGMARTTPDNFQFSVKVPETVTHVKRLNVMLGAISALEEFLEKISPLKLANKLGAILIQLPPSFAVKHYNIAAVMTDSPSQDRLQFLSEAIVTANHSFIRWHGRNVHHRYNYLYSKEELKPWAEKVKKIQLETTILRGYFNNHYGGKAVVNALQFKEIVGDVFSKEEAQVLKRAQKYLGKRDMKLTSFLER